MIVLWVCLSSVCRVFDSLITLDRQHLFHFIGVTFPCFSPPLLISTSPSTLLLHSLNVSFAACIVVPPLPRSPHLKDWLESVLQKVSVVCFPFLIVVVEKCGECVRGVESGVSDHQKCSVLISIVGDGLVVESRLEMGVWVM
jgi:hypothetical protein